MPSKDPLPEDVRDLVYRQAAVIDTQIDFNPHMERLIRQIDQLVGEPSRSRPATPWIWKVAVISDYSLHHWARFLIMSGGRHLLDGRKLRVL